MTRRIVAVLARRAPANWAPPGVDPRALQLATVEDVYEAVAGLELVEAALAPIPPDRPEITGLGWPGTLVLGVPASTDAGEVRAVLAAAASSGADQAVVVAGDAPDLPGLLLGKLFRGLGTADVAVCAAAGGGLVAFAARFPLATWAADADVGMDTPDAVARLRAAAPARRSLVLGPGWHRLRTPADLARLDPGLEGWEATRALLS
jgi:hypothetical protein